MEGRSHFVEEMMKVGIIEDYSVTVDAVCVLDFEVRNDLGPRDKLPR